MKVQLPLMARRAREHNHELRASAAAWRNTHPLTDTPAPEFDDPFHRLAALGGHCVPSGPVLLGFVGQEAVAALRLDTGLTIADPLRPTEEITALLALRARQLERRSHRHLPSRFMARRRKRRFATSA